ncbi:MAG: hypothetical protein ACOC0N_11240 [Chroococcales cyanobacterium]
MSDCPCCSHRLLRHIRKNEVYYFCRNCWQEMPLLENLKPSHISLPSWDAKLSPSKAKQLL